MSRGRTSQSPDPIAQGLSSIQSGINGDPEVGVFKDKAPPPPDLSGGQPTLQGIGSQGMVDTEEQEQLEKAQMRLRDDLQEQQKYDFNNQMGGPRQDYGTMVS